MAGFTRSAKLCRPGRGATPEVTKGGLLTQCVLAGQMIRPAATNGVHALTDPKSNRVDCPRYTFP
jgi:hypothetical protein